MARLISFLWKSIESGCDFFFPKICWHCKEVRDDICIFCPRCLVGLDVLSPMGRCRMCFQESVVYRCARCVHHPFPFYRFGAVFEANAMTKVLWAHVDQLSKTIAAFFVYQWGCMKWPFPHLVYAEKELRCVQKHVCRFLQISPCISWKMPYEGSRVLYLTHRYRKQELPKCLLNYRLFGLSYAL